MRTRIRGQAYFQVIQSMKLSAQILSQDTLPPLGTVFSLLQSEQRKRPVMLGTKSHSVSENRCALGSSIDNGVRRDRNCGCGRGHGGQSHGATFNNENDKLYCTHCCKDPHPLMTCFN